MNGIRQAVKEIRKYSNGPAGEVARTVWGFLQPPPYIIEDHSYKGKSLKYVGLISEEEAQRELRTSHPVLGLYKGGRIYITTNPLNSSKDAREYTILHEKGHQIYDTNSELKLAYPEEEVFCDLYALKNFADKYGLESVYKLVNAGIVDEKALMLYENHISKARRSRWN